MNDVHVRFEARFRAAPKGTMRPTIHALDWCKCSTGNIHSLIAFCSHNRVRICGYRSRWIMLLNKRASRGRKINTLKWNNKTAVLAIGMSSDANGHGGAIVLLKNQNDQFKKFKNFEAPEGRGIASLDWNDTGRNLLATINPDRVHSKGCMLVFNLESNRRQTKTQEIPCPYTTEFIAKFHPTSGHILSVSHLSEEISVWDEDKGSTGPPFTWKVVQRISCEKGITDFCINSYGSFIATIVMHKGLKFFTYVTKMDDAPCYPFLKELDYTNDDGRKRKGVSLKQHCENVISLDFSRHGLLLSGSGKGSFCVHKQPAFAVHYLRWSDVHACITDGPVNCVAWSREDHHVFATAGVDGVVIVWKMVSDEVNNDRNYPRECNYFLPQRRRTAGPEVDIEDVASIDSIECSDSDDEDTSVDATLEEHSSMNTMMTKLEALKETTTMQTQTLSDLSKAVKAGVLERREVNASLTELKQLSTKLESTIIENASEYEDLSSKVEQLHQKFGKIVEEQTMLKSTISDIVKLLSRVEIKDEKMEKSIMNRQGDLEANVIGRINQLDGNIMLKYQQINSKILVMQNNIDDKVNLLKDLVEKTYGQTSSLS